MSSPLQGFQKSNVPVSGWERLDPAHAGVKSLMGMQSGLESVLCLY